MILMSFLSCASIVIFVRDVVLGRVLEYGSPLGMVRSWLGIGM